MAFLNENVVRELVKRGVIKDTFRRLTADKKERVYRTAINLIGEYGYDGLSVDQLCTEAGISKGSFFQYFPSKSHLLEFAVIIFDDYTAGWVREIRANESSALARERLIYLYDSTIANLHMFPAEQLFFRYVTQAASHSAVSIEGINLERHWRDYFSEIIVRGQATGEIRRDLDADALVEFVFVSIGGLLQRQVGGRKFMQSHARDHLMTILFDGIKA